MTNSHRVMSSKPPLGNNYNFSFGMYGNQIDKVSQNLFYIEENIFSTLTGICEDLLDSIDELKNEFVRKKEITFLVLISLILLITIISISLIFYIVRQIHKTRIQSLSLYAELNLEDVREIISSLAFFMQVIKDGSEDINKEIHHNINQTTEEDYE